MSITGDLACFKEVAAGSALPGHAGHGLVGFQFCGLSAVCGLCRASILAGLAGMQGYASPLRSPGPVSYTHLTLPTMAVV